ncbi:catechol 2,3-dioxygenase-like lactoylglutathione lyase family enzyme [Pseudomonas sp. SORGH_AS199]|jgi:catechol 2,3-dioxygenase-like lactoylglutathione lyase family enzyme|uniref:VOC family protein n=1 Tax=Pseudomonas flavocrustae TaxID=2991719 RepID=A0ABT6IM98_9PSED|nr:MULTISPECIES: VOC family protein [Pseudomonas]MDH4765194.1 VOC family protein [Pseudomonas sp. CBMAI 2609]MDK8266817.1 VOC family protein [Pseudomonas oryzihabitans]MDR6228805.1 catechol 2,3-dioxygenase-like lactoylglutathione lyase family enzyme [Pseudomonas sp. SORGH_AS_0199]QNQ98079.1 drug:proton antiporter [Pseudomonas psychrotolerans]
MHYSTSLMFYVADVRTSRNFYAELLGLTPVEDGPGFALFVLPSGLALGLWTREAVVPAVGAGSATGELGFKVASMPAVDELYDRWRMQGAEALLPPTNLPFGRSFVVRDPDGNRLRGYAVHPD